MSGRLYNANLTNSEKMNKNVSLLIATVLTAFIIGAFTGPYVLEKITGAQVADAAALIGLEMTEEEIDLMLPDLEEAREGYVENRKISLPNTVVPSLLFNPLPPDFEIERRQDALRFSEPAGVKRPADPDELAFFTVRELAELIRTRQITSVELTQFFIERLRKYDLTLHCVITITEELALEQARRADAEIARGRYRGLLHGIPYGAKDLLATSRYKTTWGAMPFKEQSFDYDAAVIEKLEEAGAVLAAKLTLGALAWGDVWYGERTRNPWDPESGSSGSSAGSASAVAAGLLPFAIGTETLGSIVSPSTVCGATGLRPTFGRVSRHGAMALSWTMDKIGPITRSVEDAAIVFAAIQGKDERDPYTFEAAFNYDDDLNTKSLRIGYLKSSFEQDYPFKSQDSLTLETLKSLGYELIPIELPEMPELGIILSAEAAAAFDELTLSGQDDQMVRQIRRAWPNTFRAARFIPAVEYIQANRLRTQLIAEMDKVFRQVDVYVHPSWASPSLGITNYTGHPAVVLPNGFRDGRPTSVTFTGSLFGEAELLRLAKVYQDATDFHRAHPVLD